MVYFATSQEWYERSASLLEARPSTTRITTKYNVLPPTTVSSSRRRRKANPGSTTADSTETPSTSTTPATSRASLDLKTYDPVSGVCYKYRTDKAAEVGRLVASLGRLGRRMAALPVEEESAGGAAAEDAIMTDAMTEAAAEGGKEVAATVAALVQQAKQNGDSKVDGQTGPGTGAGAGAGAGAGSGGSGGTKKKKKGKK